jgi:DNA-nicking Smr family endonuclease
MSGFKSLKKNEESESAGIFRPFENLKKLLKGKSLPLAPFRGETFSVKQIDVEPNHPEYEQKLFIKAMAGVTPMPRGKYIEEDDDVDIRLPIHLEEDTDVETMSQLRSLVQDGSGFIVADTSEYIEGTGYCDNPEIARRLHQGDFSMQAYIDLHGMGVEAAQEAFDEFINDAIIKGKRGVLVVHGRGLSSPARAILKNKVQDWLTRGPWRKWIIAFSSARSCDGGTGATYVLLRKNPFTKRLRKKFKRKK